MTKISGDDIRFQQIQALETEIRKLKQRQAELSRDQRRFQTIFDSMAEIYFEVDLKGNLINFNPAMAKFSGYAPDELIGKNNREYTSPETSAYIFRLFNDMLATGKNGEMTDYQVFVKDGSSRFLEMSAYLMKDDDGKPIGFSGLCRDVTDRKKTEDSLKKSRLRYRQLYKEAHRAEELYQSLLSSSSDAILLTDPDLKITFANPAFTRIFGWTLPEIVGETSQYIPKPLKSSFSAMLNNVLEKDQPLHGFETQRYTKDGRLLDVSISASRYLDHAGDASGILMILRDISDAKKYQWHMEQAQRMESLGTLAGGVAHDFNNLLMGIQGRLSLLMLKKNDTDADYKHLKEIEDYVSRAADLTRQMLGIARSGKYEVKTTDINGLIHAQNQLFGRTRKEIRIHGDFASNLRTAEVDRNQIDQVLLNMYVNASHAMPQGGDLYIRTTNEILSSEMTAPHNVNPGDFIRISITDTGIGMDKSILKRIFEPFFSTKERGRGTGLGLASAYGIIKNHDGFITVYSERGKGSTFNIYLPASAREAEQETLPPSEIIDGTGTILFVDDEEMIIAVAEEMIEILGYSVITASDGHQAVEIYREKKDRIDMIILDLVMPGMGGGEIFDQLKAINPEVKVLLSSGYSINGQASTIMKRGCRGFIQKPFTIQELSHKIHQILSAEGSS